MKHTRILAALFALAFSVSAIAAPPTMLIQNSKTGDKANYQVLSGTSVAAKQLVVLTSSAGGGGSANQVFTLTGLLTTDTIVSVVQKTKGANNLPLLGYSTQATNALTGVYSADPGAGAVIVVAVLR